MPACVAGVLHVVAFFSGPESEVIGCRLLGKRPSVTLHVPRVDTKPACFFNNSFGLQHNCCAIFNNFQPNRP